MAFARFMANPIGRVARVVAALGLIALGLVAASGAAEILLAVVGVVAFLAGAVNFHLISPFLRVPFMGRDALRRS